MTLTLLVLASIAAANPFRAASASPDVDRARVAVVAVVAVAGALIAAAVLSGPFYDVIDLSGSSARIAAGVALVAVCLRDLLGSPPTSEPALAGWKAGMIPLGFPVILSPALVLIAMAGAVDRGVVLAVAATLPALGLVALAVSAPPTRGTRWALSVIAVVGTALGALTVLDGVYSI